MSIFSSGVCVRDLCAQTCPDYTAGVYTGWSRFISSSVFTFINNTHTLGQSHQLQHFYYCTTSVCLRRVIDAVVIVVVV